MRKNNPELCLQFKVKIFLNCSSGNAPLGTAPHSTPKQHSAPLR